VILHKFQHTRCQVVLALASFSDPLMHCVDCTQPVHPIVETVTELFKVGEEFYLFETFLLIFFLAVAAKGDPCR